MGEGRFEKCPTCGGSGIDDEDEPCPDCGGTGEVWSEDAEEPAIREPGA